MPEIVILDLAMSPNVPVESMQLLDRQLCKLLDQGVKILITRADHLAFLDEPTAADSGKSFLF